MSVFSTFLAFFCLTVAWFFICIARGYDIDAMCNFPAGGQPDGKNDSNRNRICNGVRPAGRASCRRKPSAGLFASDLRRSQSIAVDLGKR